MAKVNLTPRQVANMSAAMGNIEPLVELKRAEWEELEAKGICLKNKDFYCPNGYNGGTCQAELEEQGGAEVERNNSLYSARRRTQRGNPFRRFKPPFVTMRYH